MKTKLSLKKWKEARYNEMKKQDKSNTTERNPKLHLFRKLTQIQPKIEQLALWTKMRLSASSISDKCDWFLMRNEESLWIPIGGRWNSPNESLSFTLSEEGRGMNLESMGTEERGSNRFIPCELRSQDCRSSKEMSLSLSKSGKDTCNGYQFPYEGELTDFQKQHSHH